MLSRAGLSTASKHSSIKRVEEIVCCTPKPAYVQEVTFTPRMLCPHHAKEMLKLHQDSVATETGVTVLARRFFREINTGNDTNNVSISAEAGHVQMFTHHWLTLARAR